jgi:hypothetical protein
MSTSEEYRINDEAYRRLQPTIAARYPPGRFVAIGGGHIIGDAESMDKLQALLKAQGKDSQQVFVVQAGVDYSKELVIFPFDFFS